MKVVLSAEQASMLASCIGDVEAMAGTKIPDIQNPKAGGFVHVSTDAGRLTLRSGLREDYLLARVSVPADVHAGGCAWVATLPLADLLTKRPASATEMEVTVDSGRVEAVFRSESGRVVRHRTAAALAVDVDNDLPEVVCDEDPVFTVPLTADLVASLAGQVRQHDTLVANRPRCVWLTFEADQMRLEAQLSDAEATAVDFPLIEPPQLVDEVMETYGVLLGRAVARIGKVVDQTPGRLEVSHVRVNNDQRWALVLSASPYRFVLPLAPVTTAVVVIAKLRKMLATPTAVAVEVDGEDGLVSQICRESTGALRSAVVVLDFHHRHGEQLLSVHITDHVADETAAAQLYSGEYEVTMTQPLNRRLVLNHKKLADALSVLRRCKQVRLHLEPDGTPGQNLLGITPARQDGAVVTEFQSSDTRTLLASLHTATLRLPAYDPTGPVPHL